MANSYIPEGTSVICTLMQKGPNMIGISDRTSYVIHTNKKAPLLNMNDKKISDSFNCKNTSKFWGGLQALCVGIAIGALVVGALAATVLTGGAAAVLFVAVAATLGVSIGAGLTGLYKLAHDCDATKDSQWTLEHPTVRIEGARALLNQSTLNCLKGGKISIIIDPALAIIAAEQIINNNKNEVNAHMASQLVMGIITGATAATPASLVIASPLAIYFYSSGQMDEEERRAKNQENDSLGKQAADATVVQGQVSGAGTVGGFIDGVDQVTKINQALNKEMMEYGSEAAAREAAGDLAGAANASLAKDIASRSYQTPWKGMLKGFGIGIAAGVVNFGLDQWSNNYEDKMHKSSDKISTDVDEFDNLNTIGINAQAI
ncbi:DUF4280 domain-containing protein [Flavobacterium sp. LS1R49]|uniref:DUF4280 domain-containing protein n=1 Tax=Flavobacterium shii TaxID=2987687 RepID=A0A9X2ZG44_9FLAO|nr:DUF4280 domain-containing protein [Flavobacterium shii]MCV9930474.1 DUF4280 domain-containing protein [Flavobacterium shii]